LGSARNERAIGGSRGESFVQVAQDGEGGVVVGERRNQRFRLAAQAAPKGLLGCWRWRRLGSGAGSSVAGR